MSNQQELKIKTAATYGLGETEGTLVSSSILIILALGDVDRGDESSASFITSWTEIFASGTVAFPPTSSMSIRLRGFWGAVLVDSVQHLLNLIKLTNYHIQLVASLCWTNNVTAHHEK